jgi:hypothetical protein
MGVAGAALVIGALIVNGGTPPQPVVADAAATIPQITVTTALPSDLPYPSQTASPDPHTISLQQAAAFAWEEFIALNWAAVPQAGVVGSRGVANGKCTFGDVTSANCAGPTVWETYRNKVEIFPGAGTPPGYPAAKGAPPSGDPNLGFDALPQYNYPSPVPQCSAGSKSATAVPAAWVNLDETDQITIAEMYDGNAPSAHPSPYNSQPQLIRFLAKANRTMYTYIAGNKWWSGAPTMDTAKYVATNLVDPPPGSKTLVSFPPGTVEVKSAWRLLTQTEMNSHKFHMAKARYYEYLPKNTSQPCWSEDTFGMVALHIIHKTPSAPYFVYATFEQADNIRTGDGAPTEDDNGMLIPSATNTCAPGQATPCPTTPTETLVDAPKPVGPKDYAAPTPPATASPPWCTTNHGKRLYYLEEGGLLPHDGYFCVNSRDNPIPPEIIAVNKAAHDAIALHDNGTNDPFRHYKLINVQYIPIDLASPVPGIYTGHNANTGENPASFYMANGVVETDRTLQMFSGSLKNDSNSNYLNNFFPPFGATPNPAPSPPWATHKNTAYNHQGYNMGGCMGCHGSQGQSVGGNFSVITREGPVPPPEPPHANPFTPGTLKLSNSAPSGKVKAVRPRAEIRNRTLIQGR